MVGARAPLNMSLKRGVVMPVEAQRVWHRCVSEGFFFAGWPFLACLELPLVSLDSLLFCCSGWPSIGGPAWLELTLESSASFRWSCDGGGIIQAAHSLNGNN